MKRAAARPARNVANISFARIPNRCKPERMIRVGFNFDSRAASPTVARGFPEPRPVKGKQRQAEARHRFARPS
jgi:hypothetical protein